MIRRRWLARAEAPIWPAVGVAGAYALLGLGMVSLSDRYIRSVPYYNLLEIMSIQAWGIIYLAVAVLLGLYVAIPTSASMAILAHTAGVVLAAAWLVGFALQLSSDPDTTPTTTIFWGYLFFQLIRSALLIPLSTRARHVSGGR
jgi:hypothetical protein